MKPDEKGFTLIEVLVAIAITALIAGAASMTTFQLVNGTKRSNDHMTAVNQVGNAGYWVSRDAQMSENFTVENLTPPEFLVLGWTEEDIGYEHQVIYTLEAMPGSNLKRLMRNHSINGGSNVITLVAQFIDPDPAKTECEFINGTLTLTVTASPSLHSETRVYKVLPRPD